MLTTGWEADLDAGDTLVRAGVLSLAEGARLRAASVGGRVGEHDGLVLTDTGVPSLMLNAAVVTAPEALHRLHQLSSFYGDAPFLLCSPFPTGDLSSLGLQLMGHPPFMVRPPGGSPRPAPLDLSIEEVSDSDGLVVFERTLAEAFPLPGPTLPPGKMFGAGILAPGTGTRLFIGRRDSSPVAVAGAHVSHGVVHVEWVATRTEARGHGYGEALTWRATLADPSLPAVLLASDDGRAVYQRMGYLPVVRWTLWFKAELGAE